MYRVMMTIDGVTALSSAVKFGGKRDCEACASRLNRQKGRHPSVKWIVMEQA